MRILEFISVLQSCLVKAILSNDNACATSSAEGQLLTAIHITHQEDCETMAMRMDLLQTRANVAASVRVEGSAPGRPSMDTSVPHGVIRLRAAIPLAWTHVPKCGSTFANSLVRLPGVCPGFPWPDMANPPGLSFGDGEFVLPIDWPERCPGLKQLATTFPPLVFGDHCNVGSSFDDVYDNHGVIMLRQPEQRLISAYNFLQKKNDSHWLKLSKGWNVTEFARETAGCAVRMLTKEPLSLSNRWHKGCRRSSRNVYSGCHNGWYDCMGVDVQAGTIIHQPGLRISSADVNEARARLRAYAFVGITEEWSLSICLLHAMFGGECNPIEFSNVNMARSSASDMYDTSVLQGFTDEYDGALYREALSIFTANLRLYGVSKQSCKSCFDSAGFHDGTEASL